MWAGGGAPSFLRRVPRSCRCFLETPPRSFGSSRPAGLGPTQEALISRSWLLESGLATQAASPLPTPPLCLFPPLHRPIQPSLAGQPALPDGITSDRAASRLHSPAARESPAGLETPAGRSKGQCAGLPFSPTWPLGGKSDREMLLLDMGLALHSAQDGQQARLWA